MKTPKEKGDILAERIEATLKKTSFTTHDIATALAEYRAPSPILTPEQIAAGWVEWRGGECPVWGGSKPRVMLRNGSISDGTVVASAWFWGIREVDGAIIAYLPDPYEALKKAKSEGKVIQYRIFDTDKWCDALPPRFHPEWQYRIKPEPEKWAAEKAAFAAGKPLQVKDANMDWVNFSNISPPDFESERWLWRIAPEPILVELGPEDVKPGSVIRSRDIGLRKPWISVLNVISVGVEILGNSGISHTLHFSVLFADGWEINRSIPETGKWNAEAFVPCSKPADAKEGK